LSQLYAGLKQPLKVVSSKTTFKHNRSS